MNEESSSKKLNYQLQEMAFQKYPFEINNKTFVTFITHHSSAYKPITKDNC